MPFPAAFFAMPEVYRLIMVGSLLAGFLLWGMRVRKDRRLLAIYLGGMLGGLSGAKLLYILAEGWLMLGQPNGWLHLIAGKSILGALLGGYLGIEVAKSAVGYRQPTGDWFALVVPAGIALGRVGCLMAGCCVGIVLPASSAWCAVIDAEGIPRWPAPQVELGFNLLMLTVLLPLQRARVFRGQLFHIYLISYGTFRFGHEFLRATEKPFLGLSGYQLAAIGVVILGVGRFLQRRARAAEPAGSPDEVPDLLEPLGR